MHQRRVAAAALLLLALALTGPAGAAAQKAPWGHSELLDIDYQPQKVLYDVTTGSAEQLSSILDRVVLLDKLYGSNPFAERIVLVIHGKAIPFFAIENYDKYKQLMMRAASLTQLGTIEFRMCAAAAKANYGLVAKDIHGFVKMVPMADAEIVRLQQEEGFAYMR